MSEKRQKRFPNLRAGAPAAKNSTKRAPGRPFAKGKSGNPKGRPRGSQNRVTREAKAFAESILTDALVQQRMLDDARRGRLAPPVLTMLMGYAWGKPKDVIEAKVIEELRVTITDDIGEDPTSAPSEEAAT